MNNNETIVNNDETIVNNDETIVNNDETIVNNDETIVNNDETIVNDDETIVNNDIDIAVESSSTPVVEDVSTCSKKLKLDEQYIKEKKLSTDKNKLEWCYLVLDSSVLNDIVDTIGACPSCSGKIHFFHNIDVKEGLAHFIELSCTKCDWCTSFATSKEVEKNKGETKSPESGRNAYDVNIRSGIATREIGRGHSTLQNFCGFMNIPAPMRQKTVLETQTNVYSQYIKVAEVNMKAAADEGRKVDGGQGVTADEVVNTIISTDGTWKRRGFSSRNGVVTIIGNSTGKCIDYRVKTKYCEACQYWKGKRGPRADNFRRIHKCPLNHTKSSGGGGRGGGQCNLMEF